MSHGGKPPWRGSGAGWLRWLGDSLPQRGPPVRCPDPDTLPESSYLDASVPVQLSGLAFQVVKIWTEVPVESSYLDAPLPRDRAGWLGAGQDPAPGWQESPALISPHSSA